MRKIFAYLLSLSVLLFASCEKEKNGGDTPQPDPSTGGTMTFRVNAESTKAGLDGVSIHFDVGDAIAIWDGVALRKFIAEQDGSEIVFRGTAVEVDDYWAFYPWAENCLVTPVTGTPVFEAVLPATQKAVSGSFDSPCAIGIGHGGSNHIITLKNVCGFLKLSLPAAAIPSLGPGSLSTITLASKGDVKLGGDFRVSLDGSFNPVYDAMDCAYGDDSVTLSFSGEPAAAGASYYYAVLPSDLSAGITLSCTRSADSAVASKSSGSKSNSVARGSVVNLGTYSPDWTPTTGEEADDASSDPSGSFTYSYLTSSSHPRVLMCDEDFRKLRAMLADGSYPELSTQHAKVIAYADGLVGVSIPTLSEIVASYPSANVQKNRHLEELARPAFSHLFACAYAYRTTGLAKYLSECESVLTQLCADDNWYPSSFLSTAEIAMGVAIAYDWLYYDLPKAQRTTIRSALVSKAIQARGLTTLSALNNTGQVHNAGLLAAALAVWEKDKSRASALIEESIYNMPSIVSAVYEPLGSYSEGYTYWSYGTGFQCLFDEMLLTALGTDKGLSSNTGFRSSGTYRLFMADQVAPFSYADGGRITARPGHASWWYAAHFQEPSLLFNELKLTVSDDVRTMPLILCSLVKYDPINTASVPAPAQNVWVDSNDALAPVLMARRGWTGTNSDVYLGLKGGSANLNHAHMDAGSFVYHNQGIVWSTDIQQKAYSVYTDEGLDGHGQMAGTWKALVYNSLGHSTISFANYSGATSKIHPTDHIVSAKATISNSWTSGDEIGGELNLTPLFDGQVSSARRKAVLLSNGDLVIEDRITALSGTDAELIWRLVTPATVSIDGSTIVLTRGGKTIYLTTECTSGTVNSLTMQNWGTFQESRPTGGTWGWTETPTWDENHSGYYVTGFTLTIPKNTSVTMRTLMSRSMRDVGTTVGLEDISDGSDFVW